MFFILLHVDATKINQLIPSLIELFSWNLTVQWETCEQVNQRPLTWCNKIKADVETSWNILYKIKLSASSVQLRFINCINHESYYLKILVYLLLVTFILTLPKSCLFVSAACFWWHHSCLLPVETMMSDDSVVFPVFLLLKSILLISYWSVF